MQKFIAYRLTFRTPLHAGIEGIGQERIENTIRSDTLWGAVVYNWSLLFDDPIKELARETPFTLSSCYPFAEETYFLSVPIGAFDFLMANAPSPDIAKKVKKIAFISLNLFMALQKGEPVRLEDLQKPFSHWPVQIQHKGENSEPATIFSVGERPRLEIDRLTNTVAGDKFFYCTDQYFSRKSGLYFLAEFEDKKVQEKFEVALRLLGDTGLGGDRSVGRGVFTFDSTSLEFPIISSPDCHCLLSLYHPMKNEVEQGLLSHEKTGYQLVRRFGRGGISGVNRLRRSDIWMLSEGSVFSQKPTGDIPCVLDESSGAPFPVFRCGKAFSLPMKTQRRTDDA